MNAEELKCLCGHFYRFHFMLTIDREDNVEAVCGLCDDPNQCRHPFKLDNLDYLEKINDEKMV